jgi:acylpyruvate hydrolase
MRQLTDLADEIVIGSDDSLKAAADILRGNGEAIELDRVRTLQPLSAKEKIICVGLNYVDHAAESNMKVPIIGPCSSPLANAVPTLVATISEAITLSIVT